MKKIHIVFIVLLGIALVLVTVRAYLRYKQQTTAPSATTSSLSRANFVALMGNATYQVGENTVSLRKGINEDGTMLLDSNLLAVGNLTGGNLTGGNLQENTATAATVLIDTVSGEYYLIAMMQQEQGGKGYRILNSVPLGKNEISAITISPNSLKVKTKRETKTYLYTGTALEEKE